MKKIKLSTFIKLLITLILLLLIEVVIIILGVKKSSANDSVPNYRTKEAFPIIVYSPLNTSQDIDL